MKGSSFTFGSRVSPDQSLTKQCRVNKKENLFICFGGETKGELLVSRLVDTHSVLAPKDLRKYPLVNRIIKFSFFVPTEEIEGQKRFRHFRERENGGDFMAGSGRSSDFSVGVRAGSGVLEGTNLEPRPGRRTVR